MFALGCIQSLKCNTNKCPTGVTSLDPELMAGLVVGDKAERVLRYHQKTVHAALEIVGAIGLESASQVEAKHIFRRVSSTKVLSYEQQYPLIEVSAPAGFAAHPALGLDACSPCMRVVVESRLTSHPVLLWLFALCCSGGLPAARTEQHEPSTAEVV